MTLKLLLLVLVLVVAVWLILGRKRKPPGEPPARSSPKAAKPPAKPETMLACAHCGMHLPQAEARMDVAGRPYCSDAHRLLGPR